MATRQILNQEASQFLKDNFVVYNPIYRECSQDFSGFENSQVILLGKMHHSNVLENIQRKFLEIISGDASVCVIAEGLTLGVILNDEEKAQFLGLPSTPIQVIGGDARHQGEASRFVEVIKLYQDVMDLEEADQEQVSVYFRQLAGKLNSYFKTGVLKIDTKEKVGLISEGLLKEIHSEFMRMIEEKKEREKEIERIEIERSRLVQRESDDHDVEGSNSHLFQEIQKACKRFSKVVVPWGKGHFLCENNLMRALNQARISYRILLPTAQRESEAIDEITWATQKMPRLELTLSGETHQFTIQIPKIFQSYFPPHLQSICLSKTKEPIVFDCKRFIELSRQGTVLKFPAGQPIHFEHIPLEDYQVIAALLSSRDDDTQLTEEKHLKLQAILIGILNNILMLGGMKVDSLVFEGRILANHTCLQNKLVFELESDEPFTLTLSRGVMMGYATHLFNEMKRLNMKSYEMKPHHQLFLFDLSIEERDAIIKTPQKLIDWLNSKLPPGSQLSIAGELSIKPAEVSSFEGQPPREGIMLTTSKGFRFTLT